jgi:hypothetical protein
MGPSEGPKRGPGLRGIRNPKERNPKERKIQSQVSRVPHEHSDKFKDDGSGRPPKKQLRQPPIPERPADDPGNEDEDGDDEVPQVVALKEGKYLSAWEVENEKRKGES